MTDSPASKQSVRQRRESLVVQEKDTEEYVLVSKSWALRAQEAIDELRAAKEAHPGA